MWEGGLLFPLNNNIEFTSFKLCISKIAGDLSLITLCLLSVNTETH